MPKIDKDKGLLRTYIYIFFLILNENLNMQIKKQINTRAPYI